MPSAVVDPPADGRVLIVSNRLPVTVRDSAAGVEVVPSAGGLASGLRGFYQSASATWIGWPGPLSPAAARPGRGSLAAQLAAHNLRLVELAPSDVEGYYDGFSNAVLWPLFHYLLDRIPLRSQNWDAYRRVNQRFADAVVDEMQPGRSGVGARLPPDARAEPRARALPGCAHRVLPAHPVSRARSVPHPAVAARAAHGRPGRRPRRLPHAVVRASFRVRPCVPTVGSTRRTIACAWTAAPCASATFRWGPTRSSSSAWPARRRCGRRPRGSAKTRAAGSCSSASIGSTTPRAFRAGCSRSSGCCSAIPSLRDKVRLIQLAVPSRSGVQGVRQLPPAGRGTGGPDQRRGRHPRLGADSLPAPHRHARAAHRARTAPPTRCS